MPCRNILGQVWNIMKHPFFFWSMTHLKAIQVLQQNQFMWESLAAATTMAPKLLGPRHEFCWRNSRQEMTGMKPRPRIMTQSSWNTIKIHSIPTFWVGMRSKWPPGRLFQAASEVQKLGDPDRYDRSGCYDGWHWLEAGISTTWSRLSESRRHGLSEILDPDGPWWTLDLTQWFPYVTMARKNGDPGWELTRKNESSRDSRELGCPYVWSLSVSLPIMIMCVRPSSICTWRTVWTMRGPKSEAKQRCNQPLEANVLQNWTAVGRGKIWTTCSKLVSNRGMNSSSCAYCIILHLSTYNYICSIWYEIPWVCWVPTAPSFPRRDMLQEQQSPPWSRGGFKTPGHGLVIIHPNEA